MSVSCMLPTLPKCIRMPTRLQWEWSHLFGSKAQVGRLKGPKPRYDPSRYSPDDWSTGILFTILTCMTFNRRCTQIHVLFQRVKTERGMCRACCEGIQTPNALVPLTNANSFHLHSTRATPSNTHTHTGISP